MKDIAIARTAAAEYLSGQGYPAEAGLVTAGQGDEFAEVRIAMSLLTILRTAEPVAPPKPARRLAGEEC